MKYDLYLERSCATPSAALAAGGELAAEAAFDGADCRSGEWAVLVRDFVAGADIGRIVVGTGPGSFAGIRSALAFAMGWSIGSGCEVLGLPSACALAPETGPAAAVGDARRGMLWVALFDGPAPEGEIFQVSRDEVVAHVPGGRPVVSPDADRIGGFLSEAFGGRYLGARTPDAAGLFRAARANPSLLVREPLPIYLNPAVRS